MKNLIGLLAVVLTTTVTGQDLVIFDTYEKAPVGVAVGPRNTNLHSSIREGILDYGVMYKAADGYGILYKLDMSNFEKTDAIIELTNNVLVSNNISQDHPNLDISDMNLDLISYDMEELWLDFYLDSEVFKAWEIDANGKNYVVILQMNYNYLQLTLTEYEKK